LFSADHVMARATSIVAPADGAIADLHGITGTADGRDDRLLLPGHGGPATESRNFA